MSISMRLKPVGVAVVIAATLGGVGCAGSAPNTKVTHHWVSQDKVAGNVYQNDVAACSSGSASQVAGSSEFKAYQQCMNARGYSLVAANEVGEPGRE